MRTSILSSSLLFLIFLSSCSPSILKGFYKAGTANVTKAELHPFFREADSTHFFNMQIDFRKNHFSGMLIIKQTDKGTYRAALNSYFGMGIFDFEFTKNEFKVNHCMEALNKKQVIKLLEKDFRNLLFTDIQDINQAEVYKTKKDTTLKVYKIQLPEEKHYYLVNEETDELQQLEVPHFFIGLNYTFTDYIKQFPSKIRIKHSKIGLKLQLDKMERP